MKHTLLKITYEDGKPSLDIAFMPDGLPPFVVWQLESVLRRFHQEAKRINDLIFDHVKKTQESKDGAQNIKIDDEINGMTGS